MNSNNNGLAQLNFFHNNEWMPIAYPAIIRPIHYIGSKLRIINYIRDVLDKVDPSGGPVCDLFAGSGTVSLALSALRDVISVDIQEYSRVLCSALLKPASYDTESLERFLEGLSSSTHSKMLSRAVKPLTEYENNCFHMAEIGNFEPLCDLLENGSIITYEQSGCTAGDPLLISALKETHSRLRKYKMIDNPSALATRYFGGIYFSYRQASHIDMILQAVAPLPTTQKDTFLAALLSTASDVVNTIGKQFAQPLRPRSSSGTPKPNLVDLVTRDRFANVIDIYRSWLKRYLAIPTTDRPHRVIRNDYKIALKNLKGQVSVIYADPPYTRDHYSRFYHILETLCLRDNPAVSTILVNGEERLTRGIYRIVRHQSEFCIKSKAPEAFSKLFDMVRQLQVPLVLSYSPYEKSTRARPRLMTIQEIVDLAREYFKQVDVLKTGRIAHSKLTNSDKIVGTSYDAEVLITCEPD